jgi:hypothetical protein
MHDRRRAARGTLLIVGALYGVAALGLQPPYVFATLIDSIPRLWDVQFVLAGIAACSLAVWPRSRAVYAASLLMVNVAAGSRAMALLWLAREPTPAMAWLIVLTFQTYCWPHFAGHHRRRRGRE